jgi:glutaredoxin-like protein
VRLFQKLIGVALRPAAERRSRGRDIETSARALEHAGARLDAHTAGAPDTPANREALAHCVGIERWGQRRLRVGLGEPLVMDDHRPYRPGTEHGVAQLSTAMTETRAATVALARDLAAAGADPGTTVRHNDLGDLTLAGWLAYLEQHASRELTFRVRDRPGRQRPDRTSARPTTTDASMRSTNTAQEPHGGPAAVQGPSPYPERVCGTVLRQRTLEAPTVTLLTDDVKHRVRPLLDALEHEVELKVYTGSSLVIPGRDPTGHQRETLALLRDLADLSDKLVVTETPIAGDDEARAAGITRAPTIVCRRTGETRTNVRFIGLPAGYEFSTLLEAIRMTGSDRPTEDPVGPLTEPVLLQTFVTPTCPHCPRAVLTAFELALGNDQVVAEGIEATEFPMLSQAYRIASVPDTIINGDTTQRVLGAQPKPQFVEAIRSAIAVAT